MPQPIDVNTELGRIAAVERIVQVADRTSLAAQARLQEDAELHRQQAETETGQTEQKSDEVDRDLQRRTPFGGKRRRKEKQQAGSGEQDRDAKKLPVIPEAEERHDLDIRI